MEKQDVSSQNRLDGLPLPSTRSEAKESEADYDWPESKFRILNELTKDGSMCILRVIGGTDVNAPPLFHDIVSRIGPLAARMMAMRGLPEGASDDPT